MTNTNPDGPRYSAADGILNLLYSLHNGANHGTGVIPMSTFGQNLVGHKLPIELLEHMDMRQVNIFGNYPLHEGPTLSSIFASFFAIISLAHLIVFGINFFRGHYFYISLGWSAIAMMKCIGFIMRALWYKNVVSMKIYIASEVFLIISSALLITINLILAQRIFTWRHPVGGNRKLFKNIMLGHYIGVGLVIIFTIITNVIPYLNFLSTHSFNIYKACDAVSSVLVMIYSITAIALVGLAYFFKPTRKDENLFTYQPWWIKSFNPFYYVPKNSAQLAAESFMQRNSYHRHAVRVIAATHHYTNTVESVEGSLKHNSSIGIITITTLVTFALSLIRAIISLMPQENWKGADLASAPVAYVFWAGLEPLVNIIYLIGRVDLRFYMPDILPLKVRQILTAQQTPMYPSDDDSDDISSSIIEAAEISSDPSLSPNFIKNRSSNTSSEFKF